MTRSPMAPRGERPRWWSALTPFALLIGTVVLLILVVSILVRVG